MFDTPAVYPIIDVDTCRRRALEPLACAEGCLAGGARVLQLRWKDAGSGALLDLARRIVAAGRPFGAAIIINDRADVALLAGAAGVHVGQEDLAVDDARGVAHQGLAVGLSTHDTGQVDRALAGTADYVAVGPVYGTSTKETGYTARGLELVRYAAGRGKPIVAIGGITLERAREIVGAGARGLAVISDLLATGDPEARVRQYIDALASAP